MKRPCFCDSVTLWFVLALTISPSAQTTRIEGGSASLDKFVFYCETRLEPPLPPFGERLNMLLLEAGPDTVHRVMIDRSQKMYFGYQARVLVMQPSATQPVEPLYGVTFAPLSMTRELEAALGADFKAWKQLPAPKFPEPRAIRSGDVLELSLLTNTASGQRMTEYVAVQELQERPVGFTSLTGRGTSREFVFGAGTPRDVTTADVVLTLKEPRVAWSESRPEGAGSVGRFMNLTTGDEVAGRIVWVYVPNRGRFLLSLTERRGFSRAGSVRGTSLSFSAAGESYTVTSASRIAPGDAPFNLYVRHEPAWKPAYAHANLDTLHIGEADRVEYLVGK